MEYQVGLTVPACRHDISRRLTRWPADVGAPKSTAKASMQPTQPHQSPVISVHPRGDWRRQVEPERTATRVFQTDDGQLFPGKGVGLTANISAHFADAAIEFIRRKPDRPFFLHVNFTAPHDPHDHRV